MGIGCVLTITIINKPAWIYQVMCPQAVQRVLSFSLR